MTADDAASRRKPYDAFLSHNSADKPVVREIGRWLEDEAGLRVWLDEWNLVPGDPWQEGMEQALDESKCCVVFLGASGIGPWQNEEMRAALADRVSTGSIRVVPVLLPGAHRPLLESKLPPFLRRLAWVRFSTDWKDEAALHRLVCGIRGLPPGRGAASPVDECPYRGLEVFTQDDWRFFYGREALVERLIEFLEQHRFLALVGPSGSGKSSVVQAGLLHHMAHQGALVALMTPRERPLEELAHALRPCFASAKTPASEMLTERLATSAEALHHIGRELVEDADASRLLLLVDQFEELFTLTVRDAERQHFVESLLSAVDRSGPVSVILTMRSDFLGHCAFHQDLNVFVGEHLVQIGSMSRRELESAIVDPAHLVGLTFEDGLVEEILDDVKGSPGELPLLQHALFELYEKRDGARLTLRGYKDSGGIEGALTRRAEEELGKLDADGRETLRKMLVLCLVTAGQGVEDTRRRATRDELLAVGKTPEIAEKILNQWTDARLLTTRGANGGPQLVDVAHEALIRKWPRLLRWMADGREDARQVEILRRDAREWQRNGRPVGHLLSGSKLARAKELIACHGEDLTEQEKCFLAASSRRKQSMTLLLTAIVVFVVAFTSYLAFEANESRKDALLSEKQAVQSRDEVRQQLARNYWNESQDARARGQAGLSFHLISEAVALTSASTRRESLIFDLEQFQPQWAVTQIFEDGVTRAQFNRDKTRILTTGWRFARLQDAETSEFVVPRFKHPNTVKKNRMIIHLVLGAKFNSAETLLLTWSNDNTARLWDTKTAQQIAPPMKHQHWVLGAMFNTEETRIVTWSSDNTAKLWDAKTARPVAPPLEHEKRVSGAMFNRDGTRVLTWSEDNTARLWDSKTAKPIASPLEHQGHVHGATFNAEETSILTWSRDNTARLWDAEAAKLVATLEHQGSVRGAAFNADETRILTWSSDNTARLWSAETTEPIAIFEHQNDVLGAVFNSKETLVLTWSDDHTARLWDAESALSLATLEHKAMVRGAVFSADESQILTWSDDHTARLWDTQTGQQIAILEHQKEVRGAVFSADEAQILTWSNDDTARLWMALAPKPEAPSLFEHKDAVLGAVFSSDETRILTWSADHTARLWDAGTAKPMAPPLRHRGPVWGAAFDRDETRVLTWSSDNSARLWDAETATPIASPLEHRGPVRGAVFSADERSILTWSSDNSAALWDSETGKPLTPPLEHRDEVLGAVLYRNGTRILTRSSDNTARLWDAKTGQPIASLEHRSPVVGAIFNPDETRLFTWSSKGSATLWDAETARALNPHLFAIRGAVFNHNGARILTRSGYRTVRLLDTETGSGLASLAHKDRIKGVMFSHDERGILTWGQDNTARVWDAETLKPIAPPLRHRGPVEGAVFNRESTRILTWSQDNTATLWDTETGKLVARPLDHQEPIRGAVFSRDETRILSWSNNSARLWLISADLDLPPELARLQARALTASQYEPSTGGTAAIDPELWRKLDEEWKRQGRAHFEECRYPEFNVWRRFNFEEAEKIRPTASFK